MSIKIKVNPQGLLKALEDINKEDAKKAMQKAGDTLRREAWRKWYEASARFGIPPEKERII